MSAKKSGAAKNKDLEKSTDANIDKLPNAGDVQENSGTKNTEELPQTPIPPLESQKGIDDFLDDLIESKVTENTENQPLPPLDNLSDDLQKGELDTNDAPPLKAYTNEELENAEKENNTAVEQIMVSEIKAQRKRIDGLIELAKLTGYQTEVENKLFYAKAWLGYVLGFSKEKNPYLTETPITTANQIPPTADCHDLSLQTLNEFRMKDPLQKVLSLRDLIAEELQVESYSQETIKYLIEARFALGKELAKIRKG